MPALPDVRKWEEDYDVFQAIKERKEEKESEDHYYMDNFNIVKFADEKNIELLANEMCLLGCVPIIPFMLTALLLPTKVRFDNPWLIFGVMFGVFLITLYPVRATLKEMWRNSGKIEELEAIGKRRHKRQTVFTKAFSVFRESVHDVLGASQLSASKKQEEAEDEEREEVLAEQEALKEKEEFEKLGLREKTELIGLKHEQLKQKYFAFILIFSYIAGSAFGEILYTKYAFPYYQYMHLKWVEKEINPLLQPGKMVQDVGIVNFSSDSYLDRGHASCYRSQAAYCVAPIVQPNPTQVPGLASLHVLPSSPSGTYDYFAVGKNCCSCPGTGDFECGDWAYGSGQGGLRVLEEEDRANYLLAVQQWNAEHKVSTRTPIFLKWVNRPFDKIRALQAAHFYYFIVVAVGYFCALIVGALIVHFFK